jgi:hypothetical protein
MCEYQPLVQKISVGEFNIPDVTTGEAAAAYPLPADSPLLNVIGKSIVSKSSPISRGIAGSLGVSMSAITVSTAPTGAATAATTTNSSTSESKCGGPSKK